MEGRLASEDKGKERTWKVEQEDGMAWQGEERSQGSSTGGELEDRRELQQMVRESKKSKRSIRNSISMPEPTRSEWRRGRKRGRGIDERSMRESRREG